MELWGLGLWGLGLWGEELGWVVRTVGLSVYGLWGCGDYGDCVDCGYRGDCGAWACTTVGLRMGNQNGGMCMDKAN